MSNKCEDCKDCNCKQEEIKKSIQASREKYSKRRKESEDYQHKIKSGIKYLHDNKLESNIFAIDVGPYEVTFCYEWEKSKHKGYKELTYSYCVKSLKDEYNWKIAKGLLGYRLNNRNDNSKHLGVLVMDEDKTMTVTETENYITIDLFEGIMLNSYRKSVPNKLEKLFTKYSLFAILAGRGDE